MAGLLSDAPPLPPLVPGVTLSPYTLFHHLVDGTPVLLVDVRPTPTGLTFTGARPWPGEDWQPPSDKLTVLFDDSGRLEGQGPQALVYAQALQRQGRQHVRALYGGLALYDFALDPQVVGEERFLVAATKKGRARHVPNPPIEVD